MPCGLVGCGTASPNAISTAIGYAKFRSRSHRAAIRGYVQVNILWYYVQTPAKTRTKGFSVAANVPLVVGRRRRERSKHMTKPDPASRPPVGPRRHYSRRSPSSPRGSARSQPVSRKFGVTVDPQWLLCTKWLKDWASGSLGTRANGRPLTNEAEQRGERDSRVRVRAVISWRARWLSFYAMGGSKVMACRAARVGHSTADYHLKNDPDFAAQSEAAKAHAIELLHTRCFQRALEKDIEPVYYMGRPVGYNRKFSDKLQIEMLRAWRPDSTI